ncbi:MAG: hypothetical protein SGI92_22235 [Bryobacteraceae bacterium]|nr:hypothetical protein [Bryobacteraceae bacterium]
MNDEFYIGYADRAPAGLARFVRRVVIAVAGFTLAICVALLTWQSRFPQKLFEYGITKSWTGAIVAAPYPTLIGPDGANYLLVAPGKHGFEPGDLAGQSVRLEGTLIQFGPNRMLEVASPPQPLGPALRNFASTHEVLGPATLRGEIVDTKCHFGVMQPGQVKVHRSCAARCIAGGIPPGLLVQESDGSSRVVLLTRADGSRVNGSSLLRIVGEPVTLSGTLVRTPAGLVLQTNF